jgi:hypothetical protein
VNGIHYDRICVMLPTFGRSTTYLPSFLRSAILTASTPRSVSFAFCVNVHDEATKAFLRAFDWKGHEWEMIEEDLPKPDLSIYFNMLYNQTKTKREGGTVVTMMGDDFVFETGGWDARILALINAYAGVGVFFVNDSYIARERCCVNLFVTRQFVEATERPFMADFPAEMIDVVWHSVGKLTRTLHFDADTIIRHNHSTRKPVDQWDATFKRLNAIQTAVHAEGGKARAKQIAAEIAEILKRKGLVGDSI